MTKDLIIIGYFAATNQGDVVCDGPSCIVAGSYKKMKDYLARSKVKPPGKVKIIKTRFGEIVSGMRMGGAYSFDEEAYGRFLPLAREEEMGFEDVDFTPNRADEIKFLTISRET